MFGLQREATRKPTISASQLQNGITLAMFIFPAGVQANQSLDLCFLCFICVAANGSKGEVAALLLELVARLGFFRGPYSSLFAGFTHHLFV